MVVYLVIQQVLGGEMIKISKNYCCKECGNLICLRTAYYGDGYCKICANLGKLNPSFGKGMKGNKNPAWNGGKPKCKRCNKKLTNYRSNYCINCFPKTRKGIPSKIKRYGKNAPSYKDGRTLQIKYCINCNKKLGNWKSIRCIKCFGKFESGKNNPNWKGGLDKLPYTFEFTESLKQEIRIRDNFNCQICNKLENKNYRNKKAVKLSIHHIDYNKENCCKNNLISLCCKCHTKTNYNRNFWYAYLTYILNEKEFNETKETQAY